MLFNPALLKRILDAGYPIASAVDRRTGRTTSRLLMGIATAIQNPGQPVYVDDHGGYTHTEHSRKILRDRARELIHLMGLEKFVVSLTATGISLVSNFAECV